MTEKTNILVTGACGHLGQKLCRHLTPQKRFSLTRLDVQCTADETIVEADLSVYDPSWADRFEGQEVVVHLAADPRPHAPWASLQKNNVDATINVYTAALAHRVNRVVFASSCRIILGHAAPQPWTADMTPEPVDYYGATKVFGERLAKRYWDEYGLSTISLRIGFIGHGENPPGTGRYEAQRRWLSNRDFCLAVEKAIEVPDVGFAAVFITSGNEVPQVDLSATTRILDFHPQDIHRPIRPNRILRVMRRFRRAWLSAKRWNRRNSRA